ncbi:MAG: hypothetical protein II216_02600 [Alistipes sp.]|nr:hypothetical protein [Alistipes sp.]
MFLSLIFIEILGILHKDTKIAQKIKPARVMNVKILLQQKMIVKKWLSALILFGGIEKK